ncbi:hypothetical protein J8273_6076 [Carpediemonas membranifera]|uniref:Uncharacterized protein n=1 Tax=Carpediemonas membranifera TaxID=201153 RepID=A0A8J6AS19_9EUKA|nr:hypothetical protein J8273_6076 [Carpediemonas membranifera]|eukprot:KAG9392608.1 hypothetical protein J8273_6076 [Carpediemonas membranifera]
MARLAAILLALVVVCTAFPNPFALGESWPKKVPEFAFKGYNLGTTKNPYKDVLTTNGFESAMKEALKHAKKDLDTADQTKILSNINAFFSTNARAHIADMAAVIPSISVNDLYILNVWYDMTYGDASTTIIVRSSEESVSGRPIIGFSFNADKISATDDRMDRSYDLLQRLSLVLNYEDNTGSMVQRIATLAGSAGMLMGLSNLGSEGYAMTVSPNYDSKKNPQIKTMIDSWTSEYSLPMLYAREMLMNTPKYTAVDQVVKGEVRTKIPLFLTVAGAGAYSADVYITDGEAVNDHIPFTYQHHVIIVDSSKKETGILSKYDAVKTAISGAPVSADSMMKTVMTTYPARTEKTVFIATSDVSSSKFQATKQKCEYIKAFNDHASLIVDGCNNPPAPVNLAIPALSVVIFLGVITMAVYGFFERRRQMKLIKTATKAASESQAVYEPIADEE